MSDKTLDDLAQYACNLAYLAHAGQRDKAGRDYVTAHIGDVVERVGYDSPLVEACAWLHDVLEDTTITEAFLRVRYPDVLVDAVVAITHVPHEPRDAYYARVKVNPIALQVKLADVASNTDAARMALLDESTRERLTRKYAHALEVLTA